MIKKPLDFWQAVIFSDESSFIQFSCSGCVWVWRSPDQEFWMNRLQPTVKHGGFSVMVWGAIWHDGKSKLVVYEGCINSAKYIEILKEGLLPISGTSSIWLFESEHQRLPTKKFSFNISTRSGRKFQ